MNAASFTIFEEFAALSDADRSAVIQHLDPDQRTIFLADFNEYESHKDVINPGQTQLKKVPLAPWLNACLDPVARSRFPALYDNFVMTENAQGRLQSIIEQQCEDPFSNPEIAEEHLHMVPNIQALRARDTPSMIERIVGFFTKGPVR